MDVSRATRSAPLPEGAEKRREVESMFDRIAPRYDLVNRVMTLGLDRRWRRRTIASLALPTGSRILDLGCGTGDLCEELRAAHHWPVGIDLSAGMLGVAHTTASLVRGDALRLPAPDGAVDGIVSGFALRNVVDLGELFTECARVLRPGGRVAMLETDEPHNRLLQAGHRFWFRRVVPVLGGRLGRDRDAYRYLPRSAAYLPPTPQLLTLVGDAGFDDVRHRHLGGGAVQLVTGTRR
jgi:demethylmenaquinone methyltransferase/2-methoxy-6-polyprenyl-1,4-benzoquinol methylase